MRQFDADDLSPRTDEVLLEGTQQFDQSELSLVGVEKNKFAVGYEVADPAGTKVFIEKLNKSLEQDEGPIDVGSGNGAADHSPQLVTRGDDGVTIGWVNDADGVSIRSYDKDLDVLTGVLSIGIPTSGHRPGRQRGPVSRRHSDDRR